MHPLHLCWTSRTIRYARSAWRANSAEALAIAREWISITALEDRELGELLQASTREGVTHTSEMAITK